MSGGKGGGEQTVGYRYYFGIHAGIGRGPMDELREIRIGGKLAWQGSLTASGDGYIDQPELFGGETREGGVQGGFRLMMGEPDQTMYPPLAAMIAPTAATGYRRMVTLFFDGLVAALNPYPKPWSFRMRRAVKGWDGAVLRPELAVITLMGQGAPYPPYGELTVHTYGFISQGITPGYVLPLEIPDDGDFAALRFIFFNNGYLGGRPDFRDELGRWCVRLYTGVPDGATVTVSLYYKPMKRPGPGQSDWLIKAMNPAHIVFEALTNREWGRGLDRSVINIASFEAAAETLYAERFGMCIRWSRRDSIDSFIQEILDTCGATLYMDRTAALMTFKLIRKDYVREELPLFDTSNGILTIDSSTVNTATVVVNEVIVKYRETVTSEDRSVNVQNLASLQSTGGVFNTMTKTYKGIPTDALARRVAQRDLRANSEGLRRFTITMDRRGSDLVPGQVIRIQDAARNIPDTVVRVATAKEGGGTAGTIQLLVIQDVFSFPATSYTANQPNTWQAPDFTPCLGEHEVFEAPYFMLARTMSRADFSFVDSESAYAMVVAEQANTPNVGFDLAVRPAEPTADDWPLDGEASYCGFDPADAPKP